MTRNHRNSNRSEIVLGFVGPVGVDYARYHSAAKRILEEEFGYETKLIKLSRLLDDLRDGGWLKTEVQFEPEYDRIWTHMNAGDELRNLNLEGARGLLASAGVAKIAGMRTRSDANAAMPIKERAWLISSLKNPAEVDVFRQVYGVGFYLIGLYATEQDRKTFLEGKRMSPEQANQLIERDEKSGKKHGQQTQKTFELADAWVNDERGLHRVLSLIFGNTLNGPTEEENGMALAYTAALRSSDLSRQVGAAIVSQEGEVLSTGYNEVPAPGGGHYSPTPPEAPTARDCDVGYDSNTKEKLKLQEEITDGIDDLLTELGYRDSQIRLRIERVLSETGLGDITEYGRAVHAEMSALMSAVRTGTSVRGATLYCTTFPCHNCAKHIIAAGIRRVVFVEPYPKSRTSDLHADAVTLEGEEEDRSGLAELTEIMSDRRTRLEPFLGVGPRRYFDFFSLTLGAGSRKKRKDDQGNVLGFESGTATPRVPLEPLTYLEEEIEAVGMLKDAKHKLEEETNT